MQPLPVRFWQLSKKCLSDSDSCQRKLVPLTHRGHGPGEPSWGLGKPSCGRPPGYAVTCDRWDWWRHMFSHLELNKHFDSSSSKVWFWQVGRDMRWFLSGASDVMSLAHESLGMHSVSELYHQWIQLMASHLLGADIFIWTDVDLLSAGHWEQYSKRFYWNTEIFFHKNAIENVMCIMLSILPLLECVKEHPVMSHLSFPSLPIPGQCETILPPPSLGGLIHYIQGRPVHVAAPSRHMQTTHPVNDSIRYPEVRTAANIQHYQSIQCLMIFNQSKH